MGKRKTGRHYRLRVQARKAPAQPKLEHGFLVVQVPRELRRKDELRRVGPRLEW